MNVEDGEVIFGAWLPDQTIYKNPGLYEARNCIPVEGGYKDFQQIATSDDALPDPPIAAYATVDDVGEPEIYAGTLTNLYEKVGSSWTDRTPAPYTTASTGYWRFAQFDDYVVATNYSDVPQRKTIGASADFAALASTGAAPRARQIGVINRFVLLGDIDDGAGAIPYAVQWSAIDDPTDWPTPGTAGARTVQAGRQLMDSTYGPVTGIANGQFYGLVFQKRGVSRFTYVGGDVVFQIDTFERSRGLWAPQSLAEVGSRRFFIAADGFYMTDGQGVQGIGDGKVDKWFFQNLDQSRIDEVRSGIDLVNKCVFWCFPSSSAPAGMTDRFIVYNWTTDRFSWAEESVQLILNCYTQGYTLEQLDSLFTSIDDMTVSLDSSIWQGGVPALMGFKGGKLGTFTGASLDAVFETGEFDMNPFGFTFIRGIRPLVTGLPAGISVALAARNTQDNAVRVFGPAVTRNARSGVCGFRKNGRFISARLSVLGGFERAIGIQVDAEAGDLM